MLRTYLLLRYSMQSTKAIGFGFVDAHGPPSLDENNGEWTCRANKSSVRLQCFCGLTAN